MSALARRIAMRAGPLLDARRRASASWWEYFAAWAGTLLPLGAAAAFIAAACLVWSSGSARPARPHAIERAALLRVVTHQSASPELLDYVLDPVDSPGMSARARDR
jgi:hypothetical protein